MVWAGTYLLGRKDNMARVCNKFRRTFGPDNFEYFPKTFICPGDRAELLGDCAAMISPLPKPYIMHLPSLSPNPDPNPEPVICRGGRVLSFLVSLPHLFYSGSGTELFGSPVARRRPSRLSVRSYVFLMYSSLLPCLLPSLSLSLLRQRTSKSAKQKQRRARSPCGLSSPLPAARV
jgi:hypothetical protein